jgi:hypothetical protein
MALINKILASSSSYMILLDHSECMLQKYYETTRFEFQNSAARYIVKCIFDMEKDLHNISPKIGVMAGTDVMIGPLKDTRRVYEALETNPALSTTDLTTSIRVASLALRKKKKECNTQAKDSSDRKHIIVFVGSPLNDDDDDDNLAHVGRMLKRNNTDIVFIAVGTETDYVKLRELTKVAHGKILNIPLGISPSDALTININGNGGISIVATESVSKSDGNEVSNISSTERIHQFVDKRSSFRCKNFLSLQTSFSADDIPAPPAIGSAKEFQPEEDNDESVQSPARNNRGSSAFAAALDCSREIAMQHPVRHDSVDDPSFQCLRDACNDYDAALIRVERHIPVSPSIQSRTHTNFEEDRENYSILDNLNSDNSSSSENTGCVPVAEFEQVKTELRAAKRYIRVLHRLLHEKDEMISALHDMIGNLREQVCNSISKSRVTCLTLDGVEEEIDKKTRGSSSSTSPTKKFINLNDCDRSILKASLSGDFNVSIEEIRRRTRELEDIHTTLSCRSHYLQRTTRVRHDLSNLSMTDKRNKKRELEALRESITIAP